jgi:putative membrane protein
MVSEWEVGMSSSVALIPLLASIGGEDHVGWWIVAPFIWLLWVAVIATIVYVVVKRRSRRWNGHDGAKAILAERFARGEISGDEFRERLDALR